MLLLEVNNLSYSVQMGPRFGVRMRRKLVLDDVTFAVEEGTALGLLGESGSGKTTLAKCLAGLIQPEIGTITIHGLNVFPVLDNRKAVALEVQMLFQASTASLDPTMKVFDILMEGITARENEYFKPGHSPSPESLIFDVGLSPDVLRRYPHELSGGQRQRVAIARSIAVQPSVLILDEPTTALDALTQMRILYLLKRLQEQHRFSILYITHDLSTALMFCDKIAVLHQGTIVEQGTRDALLKEQHHYYTKRLFTDCRIEEREVTPS